MNFDWSLASRTLQVVENTGRLDSRQNLAMEHAQALTALLKSQTELQTAVREIITKMNRETAQGRAPAELLSKLTPEDDLESYLELFERTAARERWPGGDWGSLIAPFLSGEAQQVCRELSALDARDYNKLKAAILATQGYSMPARAQRFHNWMYMPGQLPRQQLAGLFRITQSWLSSPGDPPAIERLVIDRCIRALPPDARQYAARVSPSSVEELVALLENHKVSTEMMKGPSGGWNRALPEERTGRDRKRPTNRGRSPARPRSLPPDRSGRNAPPRRCYVCGRTDHLSWTCPEAGKDASMATATSAEPGRPCLHSGSGRSRQTHIPVRVGGVDTQALLDSGSAVTLVRPDLAGELMDTTVPVTCVHGDLKFYPTTQINVQTPRGDAIVEAGVVPNLPVPLLVGTDCLLFDRYWPPNPHPLARNQGVRRGRRRPAYAPRLACPARGLPSDEPRTDASSDGPGTPEEEGQDGGEPQAQSTERRHPAPAGNSETRRMERRRNTAASATSGSGETRRTERSRRARESATPDSGDTFHEFPEGSDEPTPRRGEFATAQWNDPNLKMARERVVLVNGKKCEGVSQLTVPYFSILNGVLYRVVDTRGGDHVEQLLIPASYVSRVLYLAHTHQLGAHLGVTKTYDRIVARFYWPGIKRAVEDFCRSCPECQRTAPKSFQRNPLIPLPIIDVPFARIAMDIVGPLPKSARGHRYILVILDYATRFPEAIPLRAATAKAIAHELLMLFSRVGIAKEILTDQGTCFMSSVLSKLYQWLKIKRIRTSVYHAQTDGLVERFNKSLKHMMKKLIDTDGKDWDQLLPYVLFAIREVPQASTGFSPFELLYGRRPRGLLDVAKEAWESQPSPHRSVIDHIEKLQERARRVWPLVREHMEQAQRAQERTYNRGAQVREFKVGDKVLVLLPTSECKFLAKWHGPYEVEEKVGPVNYKVKQPGRRKGKEIYHVNILKRWHEAEPRPPLALLTCDFPQGSPPVPIGEELSPPQVQDLKELISRSTDIFSELPGRTRAIMHDIHTTPGKVVRQRPYRIPEARRVAIKQEVTKMLGLGVIEESHSPWSSPIVIVPKPDGSLRFCNDFRKLNEISAFDAYPMPRVDELIERLGPVRFVSTLDLTKGYWQVPLTERAKPKTAFSTPEGLYQYTVLPFGVHGAPATFQRLMDRVLRPHREYAAAYLDDIIIHSSTWELHLCHLEAVLGALRRAGLTANAKKCRMGLNETDYLGFTIGRGCVRPQQGKVEKIKNWPQPATQKQLKSYLGLIAYYQKFVKNFATVAGPLYEMTRQIHPKRLTWTNETNAAFERLKSALCQEPVLISPDFNKPFLLQTDASGTGLGAVLAQVVDGDEHPILFVSRKLLSHERNYATVEKECLAVKWAIHHLRYYLWGRSFTLITDHAPLKWMARNKDTNARVTRWFLELQDYHFTVEHRPGRQIPHADALSRLYEEDANEASGGTGKLRGRMCGVSVSNCTFYELCCTEERWRGGTQRRQHLPRSGVTGGRCSPMKLARQCNQRAPVRALPKSHK